jgi:hypothetical protein
MTTLHRVASDKVRKIRPISWLKAARKDFERFPQGAQDESLTPYRLLLKEAVRRRS